MGAWWFNYPGLLQITKFELACLSGWMYCICISLFALRVSLFALPCLHYQLGCLGSSVGRALDYCLPYLAYITSWAASVAQLAEHWTIVYSRSPEPRK